MNTLQDTHTALSLAFVRQLEMVESRYWLKYYSQSPLLPAVSSQIADGVACAIPDLDILAMNRVIGLGLESPITENTLQQIVRFYKQAESSRFFVQLPPQVVTGTSKHLLLENGFVHHNNWTKLYRKAELLETATNDELAIRSIGKDESDTFGQLILMSFDWQDTHLAAWLASAVGQEGYTHYIVSWRGKDIAAGALYAEGDMASMAFAGTLESFRGMGAQSLLLKTRIQRAYELGARFITAETAQHSSEKQVKSYVNIRKNGFLTAYQRQNWIYTF